MFFPTDIQEKDLLDAENFPPQYLYSVTGRVKKKRGVSEAKPGKKVFVNETNIAIFKYKGEIFAIEDRCSHQGGPLNIGDIEEIDGHACVSCPWHGFSFDLETGVCLAPKGNYKQQVFDVKINDDGTLSLGFRGINNSIFSSLEF